MPHKAAIGMTGAEPRRYRLKWTLTYGLQIETMFIEVDDTGLKLKNPLILHSTYSYLAEEAKNKASKGVNILSASKNDTGNTIRSSRTNINSRSSQIYRSSRSVRESGVGYGAKLRKAPIQYKNELGQDVTPLSLINRPASNLPFKTAESMQSSRSAMIQSATDIFGTGENNKTMGLLTVPDSAKVSDKLIKIQMQINK